MHRRLQFAGADRGANLRHERAALAAVAQELAHLVVVAARVEFDDFDGEVAPGRPQLPGDLLRLGKSHGALARADPHRVAPGEGGLPRLRRYSPLFGALQDSARLL